MIYSIIDVFATLLESTLVISSIVVSSEPKYPKKKEIPLVLLSVLGMVLFVSYANTIEAFSFFTILIGSAYAILITGFLSKGNLLLRATLCIITLFFLHSFDSIIGFTCALLFAKSENVYTSFIYIMQPGFLRVLYTVINKSIQILFCIVLSCRLKTIQSLRTQYRMALFMIFLTAYIVMSILLNYIISDSLIIMQVAVIIAWSFILICMISVLLITFFMHSYYQKKQESDVLALKNELMEKNYTQLHADQTILSRQIHDFSNHLKVLSRLTDGNPKATEYINSLLAVPYHQTKLCHSGNEVIDAIINCKQSEALSAGIDYSYMINLTAPLQISSTDICAILSNQIDNAIEACMKMDASAHRSIRITIGQQNSFTFFKVVNTAPENPFNQRGKLVSDKGSKFHGLGLKNISETVKRYEGSLENTYENQCFTSIAMIQNNITYPHSV